GRGYPGKPLATDQELDLQRAAILRADAVPHFPAGLFEQPRGAAQVLAVPASAIRLRRDEGRFFEDLGRQLIAEPLEDLQLARSRFALRLHRPALEEAVRPFVEVIEQPLVRPLEVESQRDRLTHVRILELVSP